ncbi:hypothetical protein DCC79_10980 [bacterium]|nr:MAG: hypothetical protein DCC79_10980 [bacterium]
MTRGEWEAIHAVANVAASFLSFLLFLALVAVIVGLFMLWRGLRLARGHLAAAAPRAVARVLAVQAGTTAVADAVVAPQVRLLSRWAGAKAGARALWRGTGADGQGGGHPA